MFLKAFATVMNIAIEANLCQDIFLYLRPQALRDRYVQSVRRYGLAVQSAAAVNKLNQHAGRGSSNGYHEILLWRRR